jgi:hypothetical protein
MDITSAPHAPYNNDDARNELVVVRVYNRSDVDRATRQRTVVEAKHCGAVDANRVVARFRLRVIRLRVVST